MAFAGNPAWGGSSAGGGDQERGEHFKIFCVNCHGVNTDGKSELVESRNIVPSDLTALAQTSDDLYLAERVLKTIAGVHEVTAGQEQKMPTFSSNLEGIILQELIRYLKSIQT